ncbi:MAG: ribosome maturation factor RimM [Lachnospiraceae bacterium]|nr:ribosome maturation factor RimM [Clostridiales bacterium]MDY3110720.1 ribosome maturation factor RimM [Lachnospiraceae bacterium]
MVEEFQIGVITQTHGIKGEVKVFPTTDDVKRFKRLEKVTIDSGKKRFEAEIESVKFFKQFVILKFKGFDTIEDIQPYKQAKLLVDREHAVRLRKDEYFVADLIGTKVVSDEGTELGVMTDVIETGANDVYVVKNSEGEEILFPAIKDCVKEVDLENGVITLHVMDGLLD